MVVVPYSNFSGFSRTLEWIAEDPLSGRVHSATPDKPEKVYADIMTRQIHDPFIVLDWVA